ncbi:MAG: hypothetical protein CVU47_12465 [Chloroflexi bacterium HGW-Chloroflexi-9]|nr:MAG: hypothetical protein CVU47_12465 [Chloroflexi bacterium HGW-Chloroflexi-9]
MTERGLLVTERLLLEALYERRPEGGGAPEERRELVRRGQGFVVFVTPVAEPGARPRVIDVYVEGVTVQALERGELLDGFPHEASGQPVRPRWRLTWRGEQAIAPYLEPGWPEGVEA